MALSAFTWSSKRKTDPYKNRDVLIVIMQSLSVKEMFISVDSMRTSLFLYTDNDNPRKEQLSAIFNAHKTVDISTASDINELKEQDAVSYFLKLANGLTGFNYLEQVQSFSENFNKAKKATLIGPVLQRLFQRSIWLHEKIRLSTDYFKYPTEENKIFSELAEKIYGSVAALNVRISGFDQRVKAFVLSLYQLGCRKFVFDGPASDWKDLSNGLPVPNIISKVSSPPSVDADILIYTENKSAVSEEQLLQSMSHRAQTPFLILNISSDPVIQELAGKSFNVYCYSITDLQNIILKNKQSQDHVLKVVQPWIDSEVSDFYQWLSGNEKYKFGNIIGQSPRMQELFELISRISQTDISVLIQGESGTGKELVSRAIHNMSLRSDKPFVVVNCGAIPENLLESELFGHVRGSFTGAVSDKKGLFLEANNGTILLDEIGEMSQQLQVKLLRFLQEGDLKPVGSNETINVNVRVLAATNKNLKEMVEKGTFRSDLFYRLNVILLELPSLNERREDIPLLAEFFLKKYTKKLNKEVRELSEKALQQLNNYHWPGNVRELENAMEHAVALSMGKQILADDFPEPVKNAGIHNVTSTHSPVNNNGYSSLKDVEKAHIARILDQTSWDYEEACKLLGIGRTTLWRKIKEYNIR